MGLSPREIAETTMARYDAFSRGWAKANTNSPDKSAVPTDEEFERFQEAKATLRPELKEVTLQDLMTKIPVRDKSV